MIEFISVYLVLGLIYLLTRVPYIRYAIGIQEPYYNLGSMVFAIVLLCISTIVAWPYGLYLDKKDD